MPDRDHRETQRAGERDGSVRHAPAGRVDARVADEATREPELVEPVFDDLVHLAFTVDPAEHGAEPDLPQVVQRAS